MITRGARHIPAPCAGPTKDKRRKSADPNTLNIKKPEGRKEPLRLLGHGRRLQLVRLDRVGDVPGERGARHERRRQPAAEQRAPLEAVRRSRPVRVAGEPRVLGQRAEARGGAREPLVRLGVQKPGHERRAVWWRARKGCVSGGGAVHTEGR